MDIWVRVKKNWLGEEDNGDEVVERVYLDAIWPHSYGWFKPATLRGLDDFSFDKLLRMIRRRIQQHGGTPGHAARIARSLRKIRDPRNYVRVPSGMMIGSFRQSPVLDSIYPERQAKWVAPRDRTKGSRISLKGFSFIDEPVATVRAFRKIAEAESSVLQAQVDFADEEVLDIGPYLLWGILRQQMVPFMKGGEITDFTRQVIESVGLREFMGMGFLSRSKEVTDLWPFTLRQRAESGSSRAPDLATAPTKKEKVADEFVATVQEWIGRGSPPLKLTKSGRGKISQLVTETLDNAERHSRPEGDGHWAMAGFMSRRTADGHNDPRMLGELICRVAFLSIGSTIAETISDSEDRNTREGLDRYLALHRAPLIGGVHPEILKTVFALQDGSSRISQAAGETKGGVGMMEVAEMAVELSKWTGGALGGIPSARVAVLSGNTCVTFKDHYVRGVEDQDTGLRLQWFNVANSIELAPDPTYAASLPFRIPGTVIAVRFSLDHNILSPASHKMTKVETNVIDLDIAADHGAVHNLAGKKAGHQRA